MTFLAQIPILVLILTNVALNAAAQIFLKLGARDGFSGPAGPVSLVIDLATRPGLIGGLACYGLSLVLWVYVLSRAQASYAYPFLGLGFVLVAVVGWLFLGETMSAQKIIATLVIVAGVVLLARA
jgi:multidrug transporter EmrE-like cation transporter